eukprot:TRINITY_DN67417_c0_g1_i1.p1 TRINITY_DN67417_c0_g1~~TRINITY_DN67417_c0_g1_i1.p1  ORF type:complete len:484 (-),score=89.12 TRINITY_DN67417_c0_g1_i1:78-1529(-)
MMVSHHMDEDQVQRISSALKNSAAAIEGINKRFDVLDDHWTQMQEFNQSIDEKVDKSLKSFQRLDDTFNDRVENVLEAVVAATDNMTDVLEDVVTTLSRFNLRSELDQIPKAVMPLAIPLIILLIELAIANAYMGILLASMPDIRQRYSRFLLGNASSVLLGLTLSLVWLFFYRVWLSHKSPSDQSPSSDNPRALRSSFTPRNWEEQSEDRDLEQDSSSKLPSEKDCSIRTAQSFSSTPTELREGDDTQAVRSSTSRGPRLSDTGRASWRTTRADPAAAQSFTLERNEKKRRTSHMISATRNATSTTSSPNSPFATSRSAPWSPQSDSPSLRPQLPQPLVHDVAPSSFNLEVAAEEMQRAAQAAAEAFDREGLFNRGVSSDEDLSPVVSESDGAYSSSEAHKKGAGPDGLAVGTAVSMRTTTASLGGSLADPPTEATRQRRGASPEMRWSSFGNMDVTWRSGKKASTIEARASNNEAERNLSL